MIETHSRHAVNAYCEINDRNLPCSLCGLLLKLFWLLFHFFKNARAYTELLSLSVINEISKHVHIGAIEYLGSETRELLIEYAHVSSD